MNDRLEALKRIYKGMTEHAKKQGGQSLKQRYAAKPAPVAQPAPAEPQVSDDDMAALAEGLE